MDKPVFKIKYLPFTLEWDKDGIVNSASELEEYRAWLRSEFSKDLKEMIVNG